MTSAQARTLAASLETMMTRIARGEPIADQLAEIDRVQRETRTTAPPQLAHFLQRRSYTKALDFLKTGFVADDPNRPDCDDDAHAPLR